MIEAFQTFFLLAAIQGFLLSLILFTKKENHTANRILAFAALALSVELVYVIYYSRGWYYNYPHIMGISYPFPFLYGPLFYLYARLVSKQLEHFRWKDLLHGIPFFLSYLVALPYFVLSGEEKIAFVNLMVNHHPPSLFSVVGGFVPFQGLIYTILTIRIVTQYNSSIRNSFSNVDRINLNWLKYITVGMVVIWSFVGINFILHKFMTLSQGFDAILHILTSIMIYSIGYMGIKQPEIFMRPISLPDAASEKYQKSGLSGEDIEALKQKLLTHMQKEKPHLDNELTLQKLAEQLNLSQHNLSEVINSTLKQSYYDFINNYRVEEFKARVADPANDKYNLLSIAFDSGFKSKGTFNAIFKKFTGITPSEFKLNVAKANQLD